MVGIPKKIQGMLERTLKKNSTYSYTVHYEKDESNRISQLCDKYGSDKGAIRTAGHPYRWASHTYADFLDARFGHCRETIKTVFECGLGTTNPAYPFNMGKDAKPGASLRVWRDYFPNARIIGADLDKSTLFEHERIKTYHVDQTSKVSIVNMWSQIAISDFDLMIDDGLHQYEAGICLFENSSARLAPRGHYIIEDVNSFDMMRYKRFFSGRPFKVEYITLARPRVPLDNNQLVVIRHAG
jgi:hypothetical protein